MEQWIEIRRRVLSGELSKRAARAEYGIIWDTLQKNLTHSEPLGCRRTKRRPSKLEPFLPLIHEMLEGDRKVHRKQRHTSQRIFDRLREEHGYTGGLTIVKQAVRAWREQNREVFLPLSHPPGEAQVDFGYADVVLNGETVKVALFVMTLPYSDAIHIQAFPRECTETFLEGHLRTFEFFGGVPIRISYDNTKVAVGKITGNREREVTAEFQRLRSHFLFEAHFCLNRQLEAACRRDLERRLRGKPLPKKDLLSEERQRLRPLPQQTFEARQVKPAHADSLALVRFDGNSYSVPVQYAHRCITAVGTVEEVRLIFEDRLIARHQRDWGREQFDYEPVHYLDLLERKPGGFDHARPLEDWDLPVRFGILRRRLEVEREGQGTREFIRILRLLEQHSLTALKHAVQYALEIGASSADALRLILEYQQERPAELFCLDGRPQLKLVSVGQTDVSVYQSLLIGG